MTGELLTVPEIAAELKLNQQTIRNWIDQGKLPANRMGRRVRVRREDFEALLAQSATVRERPDSKPREAKTDADERVDLAEAFRALSQAADQVAQALERAS